MAARKDVRSRLGRAPLRFGDRVQLRIARLLITATVTEDRGYLGGRQVVMITRLDSGGQAETRDCFADELTIVRRFRPPARIA